MLYTIKMSQELRDRTNQIWRQISSIQNSQHRRDLEKMYNHAEHLLTKISQEHVECRRLHRKTARLGELEQETVEILDQIEQYITLAYLSG